MKFNLIRDSYGIDLLLLNVARRKFSPEGTTASCRCAQATGYRPVSRPQSRRDDSLLPVCVSHRLQASQVDPSPEGTTASCRCAQATGYRPVQSTPVPKGRKPPAGVRKPPVTGQSVAPSPEGTTASCRCAQATGYRPVSRPQSRRDDSSVDSNWILIRCRPFRDSLLNAFKSGGLGATGKRLSSLRD
jgi:hypothetical protein